MITIYVKPAPGLDPAAAKVLKSDTGVGLLDVAGNVPDGGMPWPNGGLTLRLLADGAILRADDPVFTKTAAAPAAAQPATDIAKTDAPQTGPTVQPSAVLDGTSATSPSTKPTPASAAK